LKLILADFQERKCVYLSGGIRSRTIGGTVREAASRTGSGRVASTTAPEVSGSGFFAIFDDIVEGHIQSA
jgi:hypothetical protein